MNGPVHEKLLTSDKNSCLFNIRYIDNIEKIEIIPVLHDSCVKLHS